MKTTLEQHKAYMARDRKADKPLWDGDCHCIECGCLGNEKCGHTQLDVDCTLDDVMICPCCNKVFDERIKAMKEGKP